MRLPIVAIIGRPNTGKSTLFNKIVGRRRAIESPVAGTTRDTVVHKMTTDEVDYLLLDTGGIGGGSEDVDFEKNVEAQSLAALSTADVIVCTINAREDITSADTAIVSVLRKNKKRHVPILLAATKCDTPHVLREREAELLSLGIAEEVIGLSGSHGLGVGELEDAIVTELRKLHFKKTVQSAAEHPIPRIAIIGKPNVGKSSIVNALMSDPERELQSRLVSPIPGTTRDSSDTTIRVEDTEYVLVDTAGLRRKSHIEDGIEFFSAIKSMQAIEDSDVVLLVLEAPDITSRQEQRLADAAIELGKGLIVVVNKGDLLTVEERTEREAEVRARLHFCRYVPIQFVSALTKVGLLKLFPLINAVVRNRTRRIPTKELIQWFETAVRRLPASALATTKYMTQGEEIPPTFILFCKRSKDVKASQLRSIENNLRTTFAFEGTPIRWILK